MDERLKLALNNLSPELKVEHDKCIAEGLKDEFCPKCDRLFLAHHHFVRCNEKSCPMSNGVSFLDMMIESLDRRAMEEFNPII